MSRNATVVSILLHIERRFAIELYRKSSVSVVASRRERNGSKHCSSYIVGRPAVIVGDQTHRLFKGASSLPEETQDLRLHYRDCADARRCCSASGCSLDEEQRRRREMEYKDTDIIENISYHSNGSKRYVCDEDDSGSLEANSCFIAENLLPSHSARKNDDEGVLCSQVVYHLSPSMA